MHIDIITILPEILSSPFQHSILKRAEEKGLLKVRIIHLRDYSTTANHQVDDYQFGGGSGMVLMIEPIYNCIQILKKERVYDEIIYLSPDGEVFDQKIANQLSLHENILLLCGHYKGVDERVRQHLITREISVGNFVLSGGELAAAVLTDAIGRLIPGVLSDATSALTDSFQDNLIAPPVYTRPAKFLDWQVPDVLLSGHTAQIETWRNEQSLLRTKERRPDLLRDE